NLVESPQHVLDNTFSHDVISIREVHEPSRGEGSKIAHRLARSRLARLHQRAAFPAHTSSTSRSECRTRLEGQPVRRTRPPRVHTHGVRQTLAARSSVTRFPSETAADLQERERVIEHHGC